MHKRPGAGAARIDSIEADDVDVADEQIRRAFTARERLAQLELLEQRLSLEMPFWMEQEVEPQHGRAAIVDARIQLSEGTNSALEVQPPVLDVIASLDGRTELHDVISTVGDRLGLSAAELSRLERDALRAIQELLELGALGL